MLCVSTKCRMYTKLKNGGWVIAPHLPLLVWNRQFFIQPFSKSEHVTFPTYKGYIQHLEDWMVGFTMWFLDPKTLA